LRHLLRQLLCLYWWVLSSWFIFGDPGSCQDPFLQGPPICWSLSWCDQSISLISPSSVPIPLATSALFRCLRHHHCGNGLLSNNVENTFNLYDGCTRC
jgi:hypothetical protein